MRVLGRLRGARARGDGDRPFAYPLDRTNDRTYPPGFEGDVYIWDIDKTYLATDFDSLRGLVSIPLELAIDKRTVAGTDVLIRGLRRGPRRAGAAPRSNPLYFVSASPPQLRRVIEQKMLMDEVEYDGITFKDQVGLVRQGRVGLLRRQMGFKLSALLLLRAELPWSVREHLFGDDSESDALIYALYADIVAGRLRGADLAATLDRNEVEVDVAAHVVQLAEGLERRDIVERIYIHLTTRKPPATFAELAPRVLPCWDAFQMALHLFEQGRVEAALVQEVAAEMAGRHGVAATGLVRDAVDLVERGALSPETLAVVWEPLRAAELVPPWLQVAPVAAAPTEAPPLPSAAAGEFVTPARRLVLTSP